MTLVERLKKSAEKTRSLICFGFDPVLDKITQALEAKGQAKSNLDDKYVDFYLGILSALRDAGCMPGAIKPNRGFYSRNDQPSAVNFVGSQALAKVIKTIRNTCPEVPVILDSKWGDIAKSSDNYAVEANDGWQADAVTVHPYMGTDSVEPFIKRGGVFILCRTSNPGAKDLQDVPMQNGKPFFMRTAELIAGPWHDISPGNVGAVVGATSPDELEMVATFFASQGKTIPLLIPGVGGQGGSAEEVMARLKKVGYDLSVVRINSSSGLNFAWQKQDVDPSKFAEASVQAVKKLNEQIGYTS